MIRTDALMEARRWIGTPYHHQASRLGAGCDCLGLVRGVWRSLYGDEPERFPPYAECLSRQNNGLTSGFQRWLIEIPLEDAVAGDVLVFAWRCGEPARHCGVISGSTHFIHAYWRRAVAESALTSWWNRRRIAAFSFPERDSSWAS
jgi:NlpC/P60 family putative phage cell wall peptidase